MKFVSLALSLMTTFSITVTDINGDSIDIEEESTMLVLNDDFDSTWNITDDQVMGGKS